MSQIFVAHILGEQLSKKEHQQSQLIKKLRFKFNESEEVCKELSEKLDKFQTQNETLKEVLKFDFISINYKDLFSEFKYS